MRKAIIKAKCNSSSSSVHSRYAFYDVVLNVRKIVLVMQIHALVRCIWFDIGRTTLIKPIDFIRAQGCCECRFYCAETDINFCMMGHKRHSTHANLFMVWIERLFFNGCFHLQHI